MEEKLKNEIKEKLLLYFNENINRGYGSIYLKVLDKNHKRNYTGVTLPYLKQYVLKEEYNNKDIAECLKELHLNNEIRSLYCGHVDSIVFNNIKYGGWNFDINSYSHPDYGVGVLHNYLDKITNNN